MKDINTLVNKIIQARKVQKERIESGALGEEVRQEEIKQMQQPVVETVQQSLGDLVNRQQQMHDESQQQQRTIQQQQQQQIAQLGRQALQHQQETQTVGQDTSQQQAAATTRPVQQTGPRSRLESAPASITPVSSPDSSPSQEDKEAFHTPEKPSPNVLETSVAEFIRQNYSQKFQKTSYEVDMNTGQLGQSGKIAPIEFLNKNKLFFEFKKGDSKKAYIIEDDKVTKGLVALLSLPMKDITEKGISYTKEDVDMYVRMLNASGYQPNNSLKYTSIVKPYMQSVKTGKGIKLPDCNHREDLEKRLMLLAGSHRAGNNSSVLRQEMRTVLDKLFQEGDIPYTLHRRWFQKFSL